MSDTVRDVGESCRERLVIIVENRLFQYFRMESRHAVDGVRRRDGEVCHPDLRVCDDGHSRDPVPVAGIHVPEVGAESAVDLLDYHVNSRKLEAEQIDVPRFECFGEDGVIRVRDDLRHDVPRIVP